MSPLWEYIWNIGYRPALGSFERRKLGVFNFMNVIGVVAGVAIPVTGLILNHFEFPFRGVDRRRRPRFDRCCRASAQPCPAL